MTSASMAATLARSWHPPFVNDTASDWTRPLELAWEAFVNGSIPVGCVITDAAGSIVAEGRNRSAEAAGNGLAGTSVAHAEMVALSLLTPGEYGNHTIWSTLEPCFMCTGAIFHSHIGTARFAAPDPLVAGVEALPSLNPWVAKRWPTRHGPRDDGVGRLAEVLHVTWHFRHKPGGSVVNHYRNHRQALLHQAEAADAALRSPPPTWQEAATLLDLGIV